MYHRRLPRFDYLAPETIGEVLALVEEHKNQARVMAGGTIVLHRMKERVAPRRYVIGLKSVTGLDGIRYNGRKRVSIGCMARLQAVADSADVREHCSFLAQVCGSLWTPQVRNMGTIGGNVACRLSTAQSIPPLIALGAEAKFVTSAGEKVVPVESMYAEFKDDAFLTEVAIPWLHPNTNTGYQRFAVRDRYDWAIAAAAVAMTVDGNVCKVVRIGLGGVPLRNARATEAEEVLEGQAITDELIEKAAYVAVGNRTLAADEMFSEQYKKKVLKTMVKRALIEASAGL